MDTEGLIRKCQAFAIKEEEEDIVTIIGRMKIKEKKLLQTAWLVRCYSHEAITRRA